MPIAEYMGRAQGHTNGVTRRYPVANGATVTSGDFVTLVDGRVAPAAGGAEILGVVEGGDTANLDRAYGQATTGNAAGTTQVLVNIEKDARYLVKTSGTVADADIGDRVDITGGTGAQTVTLGTAGTQLVILDKGEGLRGADATYAVVAVRNSQLDD